MPSYDSVLELLKDGFQSSEKDNCKIIHASYIYTAHMYHLCLKKGISTAKDLQTKAASEELYGPTQITDFFLRCPRVS